MGQPAWRLVTKVEVPEREAAVWTPALDYVSPGRLYRIVVEAEPVPSDDAGGAEESENPKKASSPPTEQRWTPEGTNGCTADGDFSVKRSEMLLFEKGNVGALLGRIGGGTASADAAVQGTTPTTFAVGRYCVFEAPAGSPSGALFLAPNDTPNAASKLMGTLQVSIYQAL